MNITPISAVTTAYIAGILAAKYADIPFFIFWTVSLCALFIGALFKKTRKRFAFFVLIAAVFLGASCFRNSQNMPPDHVSRFISSKSIHTSAVGLVASDPVTKGRFTAFVLNAKRLGKRSVSGKILVKVSKKDRFVYGDMVFLEGSIYRVPYFRISRTINYRDYLKQKKILAVFNVGKESTIRILKRGCGNPVKSFAISLKNRFKDIIAKNMSPFSNSALAAMLLGERGDLSEAVNDIMVQSGTIHIISISGLHAGLAGLIVLIILRMMRIPKKACHIAASIVLIVYCMLTGASVPVVRVTIMSIMLSLSFIMDRETNVYNALSAAALLILLYNPQELFNISFQLSFGSIFFIAWLSPRITGLFSKKLLKRGYPQMLIRLFSASLAAWLGLTPLVAYYFNIISFVAILANMLVIPYFTIVMGSGIAFVFLGSLSGPLGHILSSASELSIICLFKMISLFARFPGAYINTPNIPLRAVIYYYLTLAFIFNKCILIKKD